MKLSPTSTAKITVVATANPKRKGSASASRFRLYGQGCTIKQYVAKVEAKGGTAALAIADVLWDSQREYIRIGAGSK